MEGQGARCLRGPVDQQRAGFKLRALQGAQVADAVRQLGSVEPLRDEGHEEFLRRSVLYLGWRDVTEVDEDDELAGGLVVIPLALPPAIGGAAAATDREGSIFDVLLDTIRPGEGEGRDEAPPAVGTAVLPKVRREVGEQILFLIRQGHEPWAASALHGLL